jgi:hypothetical protein
MYRFLQCGFCVALLAIVNYSEAADNSIEIVKAEGQITSTDSTGKQETAVATHTILSAKNTLLTTANGRAVVRVGNAGYIVVEKNSKIEIGGAQGYAGIFRQVTGMIYYALNSIKKDQHALEIRTSTASLGIRGTRFLVIDIAGRNEVGMRKGLINVSSLDGEFEVHKTVEQDEFDAFKLEGKKALATEKREFEEFKASTEREFVEYKREFKLGENYMASFDGKKVNHQRLSSESNKNMESAEDFAQEWLKKVRD